MAFEALDFFGESQVEPSGIATLSGIVVRLAPMSSWQNEASPFRCIVDVPGKSSRSLLIQTQSLEWLKLFHKTENSVQAKRVEHLIESLEFFGAIVIVINTVTKYR